MHHYILHSTCDLAETLELVRAGMNTSKKILINGTIVNITSLRLKTYVFTGTVCTNCGLAGEYFALEKHKGAPECMPYHLNLYGINDKGEDVLFTHDHVLARCLGGKDSLENTQTMCLPCNGDKGKIENIQYQFEREVKQFNKRLKQWGKVLGIDLEGFTSAH